MPGGISGLYVGTYGANEYRKTCGEECEECPYYENGLCRIDEHNKNEEASK